MQNPGRNSFTVSMCRSVRCTSAPEHETVRNGTVTCSTVQYQYSLTESKYNLRWAVLSKQQLVANSPSYSLHCTPGCSWFQPRFTTEFVEFVIAEEVPFGPKSVEPSSLVVRRWGHLRLLHPYRGDRPADRKGGTCHANNCDSACITLFHTVFFCVPFYDFFDVSRDEPFLTAIETDSRSYSYPL